MYIYITYIRILFCTGKQELYYFLYSSLCQLSALSTLHDLQPFLNYLKKQRENHVGVKYSFDILEGEGRLVESCLCFALLIGQIHIYIFFKRQYQIGIFVSLKPWYYHENTFHNILRPPSPTYDKDYSMSKKSCPFVYCKL